MIRSIIYLICIVIVDSILFTQSNLSKTQSKCYSEKIRLNIKNKEFKDTLILVRNYIDKLDEKRIICNNLTVDRGIDKLIFESEYISTYLTYQNRMNKFSIISYNFDYQNKIIVSYFLSDRKTKEAVEMVRFKIANRKIVGINMLPGIYERFMPINEFDNQKIDIID